MTDTSRVLISAYSCDPGQGSEPGVGWEFSVAASSIADEVVIFTRDKNVSKIHHALRELKIENVLVVGHDLNPTLILAKRRVPFGRQIYYFLWQLSASKKLTQIHLAKPFSIAHHVTLAVDWMPSAVSRVLSLQYVWGPVGGVSRAPLSLWHFMGLRGASEEALRLLVTLVGRSLFTKRVAKRAKCVIAANDEVGAYFRKYSKRLVIEPNAVIRVDSGIDWKPRSGHIVTAGRLLPLKGIAILIDSLRFLPPHWSLSVVGDGPDFERLVRRAQRRGVSTRVQFLGRLTRAETLTLLASAAVVVQPSLHESSGWVVAEAVTIGVPIVGLDLGGTATILRRSGGTLVPVGSGLPRRLAKAVCTADRPVGRGDWEPSRLRSLLNQVYEA